MKYSIIIADDEPNARIRLEKLIRADDELELLGSFKNGLEVLKFCKGMSPDILLLDIQMPGSDGLETARALMNSQTKSAIAFITAYDEFALKAFQVEAVGYLLKPFSEDEFRTVLSRLKSNRGDHIKEEYRARFERLWERMSEERPIYLERFPIKEKGLIIEVPVSEVEHIVADGDYIQISSQGKEYLHRATMQMVTRQLPPQFLRIHRSIIINTRFIDKKRYLNNGTFEFTLKSGKKVVSSRGYKEGLA